MDVLADILDHARAKGGIYARAVLAAPWGLRFEADPCVQFHVVLEGSCLLRRQDGEEVALHRGDVVFVVAAEDYELLDAATSQVEPFAPYRDAARRAGLIRWPGAGQQTTLLCGGYTLEREFAGILRRLPPTIHVEGSGGHLRPSLRATVDMLADEIQGGRPGAQLVADRLVDALLVQVLRAWLDDGGAAPPGWASSADRSGIGTVIQLLHERPHERWTLERLASETGMSRSTLARRFTAVAGEPPVTYLTRWRMTLAMKMLRDTAAPMSDIAERTGYVSAFAFSTAFKRTTGEAPTQYRARVRPKSGPAIAPLSALD